MRGLRLSTSELLLLALFAVLVVLGSVALRLPVKMPGHSGLLWMALLVVARGVMPRHGAATAVGLLSGLLAAAVLAADKGAFETFALYASAGFGVDVVAALTSPGFSSCALAGAVGNLTKLGTKLLLASLLDLPIGSLGLGPAYPIAIHAIVGLAGGALGFLLLSSLRRFGLVTSPADARR